MKLIEKRISELKHRLGVKEYEYVRETDMYRKLMIGRDIDRIKDLKKLNEAILYNNIALYMDKNLQ